jgi:hypothetical protein
MTFPPFWCLFFSSHISSEATWMTWDASQIRARASQNVNCDDQHCHIATYASYRHKQSTQITNFCFSDTTSHVLQFSTQFNPEKELHKLPWAPNQYNQLPDHLPNEVLPTFCAHPLRTAHLPTLAWYNYAIINIKEIESFYLFIYLLKPASSAIYTYHPCTHICLLISINSKVTRPV